MNSYNSARPSVMHIDLNSCFATIEQQSRPMLRGRPVAILNRRSEHTSIITASYEAKALGIGLGMSFREAKRLCPELIGLESDPPKYRYVYHKLLDIMNDYSAHVRMKSIDEGVIDFADTSHNIASRDLVDIGYEIKQRLKDEVGCAMRCNVGIAPNRFLAKVAAGLNKPDGLDIINAENLRETFSRLELTDLTGIAKRYEARLRAVAIDTPLDFLDASKETLEKVVFKSICGAQWHQRLRGWEVDRVDFSTKRVGRQYVLEHRSLTREAVLQRLHNLCESVGGRLRRLGKSARGVYVYARSADRGYWHAQHTTSLPFCSDNAIYRLAASLFLAAPEKIREIGVHVYLLSDDSPQMTIFGDEMIRESAVVRAIDEINSRYGERTVHAASTIGTRDILKERIPFGSTRYL